LDDLLLAKIKVKGKITLRTREITLKDLLGIHRRIEYANKKYHSGLICKGVTRLLASKKFSTSPNRFISIWPKKHKTPKEKVQVMTSFTKNSLKKFLRDTLIKVEFDPVRCSRRTCLNASNKTTNGIKKCRVKKRLRV